MDESVSEENHQRLWTQYTELASLAGALAHEIKNRLSTLNLNLQLLSEDFQDAQSQRERRVAQKTETLQREVARLEEILNDFLRFARVQDLQLERDSMISVVRETISSFELTGKTGILVRENLPATLPAVLMDRNFFEQALLNLLINSSHAMPEGGELILNARADADNVYLDVIDTGEGMSPETLKQVFKPFYSSRKGGSGLGLPTARKIIEAHNGSLTLESEPGKGTACRITLPVAK